MLHLFFLLSTPLLLSPSTLPTSTPPHLPKHTIMSLAHIIPIPPPARRTTGHFAYKSIVGVGFPFVAGEDLEGIDGFGGLLLF